MVAVDRLGKRFGERWAFRGISFTLSQGNRLVVLGANGAGKSTLLKTIAGLVPPTEGKLTLPGDLRLTLGLAALDMSLYPSLTCEEHLHLAARLRGCDANSSELLAQVGLEAAREKLGTELSTGMKMRLKFALAMQTKPKLLLLDEPGAALDARGEALLGEICEEQSRRGALILATNDPAERRYATHELELAG